MLYVMTVSLASLLQRHRRPRSAVVARLRRKSGRSGRLRRNVGVVLYRSLRVYPPFSRRRGRNGRTVWNCRLRRGALSPWRNRRRPVLHRLGVRFALCGRSALSAQLLLAGFQLLDRLFQRGDVARHCLKRPCSFGRKRGLNWWSLRRRRNWIRRRC